MKRFVTKHFRSLVLLSLFVLPCSQASLVASAEPCEVVSQDDSRSKNSEGIESQWNQWRGPLNNGVSPTAKPPISWSEDENIKWKAKLSGLGHSSPVVWGNTIFLTSAKPIGDKFEPRPDNAPGSHDNLSVDSKHQFIVTAIERETGEVLWTKVVHEAIPHEGGHYTGSLASASPITDGKRVFAYFGSHGLYCLDLEGNILWSKNLGTMHSKHAHGEGSSPALYEDRLVVNWDHEDDSFIVALDTQTGEEVWKHNRKEVTSWSSPTIVKHKDTVQVIVAGTEQVRSYDLQSGEIIWECGGLSHNVVATPVVFNGIVIVASSYEIKSMISIDLDLAKGNLSPDDVDGKAVLWRRWRSTPYVPSPMIYDDVVYFLSHYQGILSRVEIRSGDEPTGPFRLPRVRDVYASLVGADGRIYIADRDGVTMVLANDEVPRILARNLLDDRFSGTPALIDNQIILRGEEFLYCIEAE